MKYFLYIAALCIAFMANGKQITNNVVNNIKEYVVELNERNAIASNAEVRKLLVDYKHYQDQINDMDAMGWVTHERTGLGWSEACTLRNNIKHELRYSYGIHQNEINELVSKYKLN